MAKAGRKRKPGTPHTERPPEGYAVASAYELGNVQIYPVVALEEADELKGQTDADL